VRRTAGLALLIALAAGPTPAADGPRSRPVDRPAALSDKARAELCAMLLHIDRRAKPTFPRAAMTLEQARHYADVPPKMTWQGEFGDWFVFGIPDRNGGPDRWSGVYFVQKGSNVVGFYRQSW
jgi:hypothetical protein